MRGWAPANRSLYYWGRQDPLKKGEAQPRADEDHVYGAEQGKGKWKLTHPIASVAFPVKPGETLRLMLSLKIPKSLRLDRPATIAIFQRDDRRAITGSVQLEIRHARHKEDADMS